MELLKSRKRFPNLAVFAVCGLIGCVGLPFTTAVPFRSITGRGVGAREANSMLWHCHLPSDASNVWFVSGYRRTRVECDLPLSAFTAWCKIRDWTPVPIDDGMPMWVYSIRRDSSIEVRRGLRFDDMNGDVGYDGIYDIKTETAYVTFSGG